MAKIKRAVKKVLFAIYMTVVVLLGMVGVYFLYMASGCESGAYCG